MIITLQKFYVSHIEHFTGLTDFKVHEGENMTQLTVYLCELSLERWKHKSVFLSGSNRGIFKRAPTAKLRGSAFEGDLFLCEVGVIEVWNRSRSTRESGKNCRHPREQRPEYHTDANKNTKVIDK